MEMNDTRFTEAIDLLNQAAIDLTRVCDSLRSLISSPAPAVLQEEPRPTVTKDMLRERLTRILNDGHREVVQTFFSAYDAERLSEIPESKYDDLYLQIEEYENTNT